MGIKIVFSFIILYYIINIVVTIKKKKLKNTKIYVNKKVKNFISYISVLNCNYMKENSNLCVKQG